MRSNKQTRYVYEIFYWLHYQLEEQQNKGQCKPKPMRFNKQTKKSFQISVGYAILQKNGTINKREKSINNLVCKK